jgi:hypothetical protein
MTIWLLAILLLGGAAAVGYTQGAIRVGVSFFGIIISALMSVPLAKLVKPAVVALGVKHPVLQFVIPPCVVFLVLLSIFKVIGLVVHKKVDVHYKYKAGDLRLALFERLNARLGAALGTLNGLAYLVVICWAIYPFSYWSTQLGSGEADPKMMRLLNQLGHDLQSTGMAKVARAVDGTSATFYQMADLAGLLYQNSLLEARLSRYPAFLTLAERPEFKAIGSDQAFSEMRLRRAPIRDVLANPNISAIVNNPDEAKLVWNSVVPDLKDLQAYLETGKSEKYNERILGHWSFDINAAIRAYRRAKPNMPSTEMQKFKRWMTSAFLKTSLLFAPDGSVKLKNLPQIKTQGADTQNYEGTWKSAGSEDFVLDLTGVGERKAKIDPSGRLVVTGDAVALVFTPED